MDICLLINTCKQYFENVKPLVQQINASNFNKANVLIVSGQEDEDDEFYCEGIKIVKVKYSGSHLTSVVYACENMNLFSNINYWIVLPCTVKFGETFFDKITDYYNVYLKDKEVHCLPFLNPNITPTMDLGIVHSKHILNMTNYLKKIKTFDMSYNNLINLKKQLVYDENIMMGLGGRRDNLCTKFDFLYECQSPTQFITDRHEDLEISMIDNGKVMLYYFKKLDFYKTSRNFNGPDATLIINLYT
jgi:hypothetical protein